MTAFLSAWDFVVFVSSIMRRRPLIAIGNAATARYGVMQVSLVLQLTPQVHLLFRLRRASSSGVTHQLRPDLLQVLMDTARLPKPVVWTRRQRSCKAKPRSLQPALAQIPIGVLL